MDAIKSVEGKYDNFMAQHPVLNDIKTGAEVVDLIVCPDYLYPSMPRLPLP